MKHSKLYTRRIAPYALVLALLVILPVPAIAQEPTPESSVYVVQRGDTLYGIAERFGTTVEAIVNANGIDDPSLIVAGQKLQIPAAGEQPVPPPGPAPHVRVHTVRPGETLPFLAFRYGTTVPALRAVNDIHRLGLLLPGQTLTIPSPVAATAGTPTFPTISAKPATVAQGRTLRIQVQGTGALDLSAQFMEKDLIFYEEEDRYWALVGVDALTPPGGYPLTLTAIDLDSGDRLTMQETFTVTAGTFPTYNVVVSEERQSLLAPKVVQAERKKVNEVFGQVSPERLWDGLFAPPLRGELRITAPFGQRRSYNSGPVSSYHSGLDYGADKGCLLYTSPSPRDRQKSRMPSSA